MLLRLHRLGRVDLRVVRALARAVLGRAGRALARGVRVGGAGWVVDRRGRRVLARRVAGGADRVRSRSCRFCSLCFPFCSRTRATKGPLSKKRNALLSKHSYTQQPPRGRLARGRCLSLVARGLRLRGAGRAVSQAQQVDNRRDGLGGFGFGESRQRRQRRRDECRSALSLLVSVQPSRSESRCCSIPAAASSRGVQLRERRRGGGRGILCCAGGLPSTAAAAAAATAATPSASAAAPRAAAAPSSSSAPRRRQPVRAKVRKREEIRYVFFSTRV